MPAGRAWWFWPVVGLLGLLLLGTFGWGWQIHADLRARQVRAARALRRQWSPDAPALVPLPRRVTPGLDDDQLLRRLLGE